jgi:hypothetical protein
MSEHADPLDTARPVQRERPLGRARRNGTKWGNPAKKKSKNDLRLAFINPDGIPIELDAVKYEEIKDYIKEADLDQLGLSEINLNLKHLPSSLQWRERTRLFPPNNNIAATNEFANFDDPRNLPGGAAMLSFNSMKSRFVAKGTDSSGLGRWVWTKYQGKGHITLRVITGYRPVEDKEDGAHTVFSQQESVLKCQDDDRNPRDAFLEDLRGEVMQWQNENSRDLIVLYLDMNEDVRSRKIKDFMSSLHLVDAHHRHHPHLPPVETCDKNESSTPIDGIWVSPSIEVTACGYCGYGEQITKSDHRALWVDISKQSVFNYTPRDTKYSAPDRVNLDNSRATVRYNNLVEAELRKYSLPQRLYALQSSLSGPLSPAQASEYESIGTKDFSIRQNAKRRARKLCMGNVDYSDVIDTDRRSMALWDLVIRRRQGHRASVRKIRRLQKSLSITTAFTVTLLEAFQLHRNAFKKYKQDKKQDEEHRQSFYLRLASDRAKKYHTTVAVQQKMLKGAFKQRKAYRRIKQVLKGSNGGQLSAVDCPVFQEDGRPARNPDGSAQREYCVDQADVEKGLEAETIRRMTQSHNTPFTREPLLSKVGWLGTEAGVEEILAGTFEIPPDTEYYAAKLIPFMSTPEVVKTVPPLSTAVTTQNHCDAWAKMRPNTSSSPHGPDYTDYIAGSQNKTVAAFDAAMSNIPYATGYTPKIWQNLSGVMIPKKTASTLVEKVRIIVLFHALWNRLNKLLGRDISYRAEELNLLPWEAYGGRKGKRSIECAVNKVFTNDILRQKRQPGTLCSNDAKSCYDRILHSVATICMRRVGVQPEPCQMLFGTLQQCKFWMRTAFGDSHKNFGALELRFQGVMQGNGAGPTIWLVVSIPIINMLRAQGFGIHFCTPVSGETYDFVCYTYVDDTDLVSSLGVDHTVEENIDELQKVVDHWEGGIRATGGALVPEDKSYWYSLSMKWHQNKWKYESISDHPGEVSVRIDDDGNRFTLDRLEVSQAKETIGVFLSMDGNQRKQVEEMTKKSVAWADLVRCGRLAPHEAWLSLNHGVLMSLRYPLMACSLSESECEDIMRPLLNTGLPAISVTSKFPRVVVHGPKDRQGFRIPHLWTSMHIEKFWLALQHGHSRTITGCQLRHSMEIFRLEAGLSGHIFHLDGSFTKDWCTPTWISKMWPFLSRHRLYFKTPTSPPLQPRRVHDKLLMEVFSVRFNKTECRNLKRCSLWLHALRLSCLTTGDGQAIIDDMWEGEGHSPANHDVHWEVQGRPSSDHWNLWRSALTICFVDPRRITHRTLQQPLGEWYDNLPESAFHLYISPAQDLFFRKGNRTTLFRPTPQRRITRNVLLQPVAAPVTLPPHCSPTTVFQRRNGMVTHSGYAPLCAAAPITDRWAWVFQRVSWPDHGARLAEAIRKGTAIAVCDGSYKNNFGTAAIILQDSDDDDNRVTVAHCTPGHPSEQNPYRSELGGILAIYVIVERICQRFGITEGAVELGCDCESGLKTVYSRNSDSCKQSHDDLLQEIRHLRTTSPLRWTHRHIDAHQDDHQKWEQLTIWEQLNVQTDSVAKATWNEYHSIQEPFYIDSTCQWSLWQGKRRISSLDEKLLYDLIHGPQLERYWIKKARFTAHTIKSINWEASGKALKSLDLYQRLWVSKWVSNKLPIGSQRLRIFPDEPEGCPRCGEAEDRSHILRCPHHGAQSKWHMAISKLDDWMQSADTLPDLRSAIIQRMRQWHQDLPFTPADFAWPGVNEAVTLQDLLGWQSLFDGTITESWTELQHNYFEWRDKRNTGLRWATSLIHKCLLISWDLWKDRQKAWKDPTSIASAAHNNALDTRIHAAFAIDRATWTVRDRRWFRRSSDEVCLRCIEAKTTWLAHVDATVGRIARRQHPGLALERRLMRRFLTRRPPPHSS